MKKVLKNSEYYLNSGKNKCVNFDETAPVDLNKALKLATTENFYSQEEKQERLKNIYYWLYCTYYRVLGDFNKAFIAFENMIEYKICYKNDVKKIKDLQEKIKNNPEKYDEKALLKLANTVSCTCSCGYLPYYLELLVLKNNPKCDEIRYYMAKYQVTFGNNECAYIYLEPAIKINPYKQEYYDLYIDALFKIINEADTDNKKNLIKEHGSKLKKLLNKSIKIKPTARNYEKLSFYYSLRNKNKLAIEALDKSLELEENAYLYPRRGWLKYENNDIEGAIQDFRKALELYPDDDGIHELLAKYYKEIHGIEKACEFLDQRIEKFKNNTDLLKRLLAIKINLKIDANQVNEALQDTLHWINNPEISEDIRVCLYSNAANCCIKLEKWEDSIKYLDLVLDETPNYMTALYDRACSYINLKEYKKALADVEKADKLFSEEYGEEPISPYKSNCLTMLKRYEESLKYINNALKKDKYYTHFYLEKALLYLETYKPKKVIQVIDEAEKLLKKDQLHFGLYLNRGLAYYYLGEYKKAIKDLNKSIKLNPIHPNAYIIKAYIKHLLGDSKSALEELFKLKEQYNNIYTNSYIIAIYYSRNEFKKALEHTIATPWKDEDEGYFWQGVIYTKIGKIKKAKECYNKAFRSPNSYPRENIQQITQYNFHIDIDVV